MKLIIAFFRVVNYLLLRQKFQRKGFKLDRSGAIAERDKIVQDIVPAWARFIISLTGKKTTVTVIGQENLPKDTAVVFIANHQGYMDIPVILGYIGKATAFISKIEILKIPLISGWMRLMQCTFLDRKNPRQSIVAMAEAVETVKKGYSLVIFPEGHRSKGGAVKEFKAGSFKLAFRSGVPIVPVTIDGTWRLLEKEGKPVPADVTVTIHPAVPTAGISKEEQAKIPALVQAAVESSLR